ncbi:MAG TPA: hypothetical protein VI911_11240 [Patescibacteria group bacterium]|nr:hypothetical protein [Patescibacteria group bacterium]
MEIFFLLFLESHDALDKYLINHGDRIDLVLESFFESWLFNGFYWEHSPEGYGFWFDINADWLSEMENITLANLS